MDSPHPTTSVQSTMVTCGQQYVIEITDLYGYVTPPLSQHILTDCIYVPVFTWTHCCHLIPQFKSPRNLWGEWPSGLYSLRQVAEVRLGRVRGQTPDG